MKKNLKKQIHNQKGMTITEIIIALGITSILAVIGMQVMQNVMTANKSINTKLDQQIDLHLGDRVLLQDIRVAVPSMNFIRLRDDNGNSFFDYDIDRSSAFYTSQRLKSRTFTLSKNGKKEFYFVSTDESRGESLFADAVTFFNSGGSPVNAFSPTTLTYAGVNKSGYLTTNGPKMLQDGKLLMVDSSSLMSTLPIKPTSFLGVMKTSGDVVDLIRATPPDIKGAYVFNYNIKMQDGSIDAPINFKTFMYFLPPVGSSGGSVRIKPVNLYKYQLDCSQPDVYKDCVLNRISMTLSAGAAQEGIKIPVIAGFDRIIFSRDDLSSTVIKIDLEKAVGPNDNDNSGGTNEAAKNVDFDPSTATIIAGNVPGDGQSPPNNPPMTPPGTASTTTTTPTTKPPGNGGGGGGCFIAGTQISMADGSTKNIEDVQVGELIRTFDEVHHVATISPIAQTLHHEFQLEKIYTIHLSNSKTVSSNHVHAFFVPGQNTYLKAEEFALNFWQGKQLNFLDENSEVVHVTGIELNYAMAQVYNLHVVSPYDAANQESSLGHNYYANGILVHNMNGAEVLKDLVYLLSNPAYALAVQKR